MGDAIREAFENWWSDPKTNRRLTDMNEGRALYLWKAGWQAALQSGEPVFMWCKASDDPREQDVVDVDCACEYCVPLYTTPQPMVPECLEQFRDFVVDRQFWQIAKINNGNAPLYVTEIEYNALRNLLSAGKETDRG